MDRHEFETLYANEHGLTVEELHNMRGHAEPRDGTMHGWWIVFDEPPPRCGQGYHNDVTGEGESDG